MLEDHFQRLRSALTRPSPGVDFFWAGLSYVITVIFYIFWLFVTLFRITRSVLKFPIVVLRWLLFLQ